MRMRVKNWYGNREHFIQTLPSSSPKYSRHVEESRAQSQGAVQLALSNQVLHLLQLFGGGFAVRQTDDLLADRTCATKLPKLTEILVEATRSKNFPSGRGESPSGPSSNVVTPTASFTPSCRASCAAALCQWPSAAKTS